MIITLVMDQFGKSDNGTTVTAMRFAQVLKEHGHTIRVVAVKHDDETDDDPNFYGVEKYHIPVFDNLIKTQGMTFAKPDDVILKKAIEGSDVVHLLLPFAIQRHARLIAKELGIATTAAFHLQPENITYTCFVGKVKKINDMLYNYFRRAFYKYFDHIHCPSVMIRDQLIKHKYKGHLHVISNGVAPSFKHIEGVEKPEHLKGKYVILMVGRLSREKRQDILIEAIGKSKYNKDIQLVLCGKGPWRNHLKKLSDKHLANPVIFEFLSQPDLLNVINYSDLYVHASDAEIEAISCMEAFTCGLVPIISNSELTATKQFAQDPHCLFEKGNSESLRTQIDYFIEHPDVKAELSKKYIEYAKQYALDYCVSRMEEVFQMAIDENEARKKSGTKVDMSRKELRKLKKIDENIIKQLEREEKLGHIKPIDKE